ncbi:hypothetical protein OQA88_3876 [Cercophora sp. LCS_1]
MATNSCRGNDIGTTDGPPAETCLPKLSQDVKSHINDTPSSTEKVTAEHVPGKQGTAGSSQGGPEADMRREMEGLGRSEVAKRGGA